MKLDGKVYKKIAVIWDQEIERMVTDLMKNAVRATRIIEDPWNRVYNQRCSLWLSVLYEATGVLIRLANDSAETAKEIQDNMNQKSGRWRHLEEIGGRISFPNIEGIFEVDVLIPCAGSCRTCQSLNHA